ncbi:sensor histidine kinase [Desulfitobacterium metallireducens]|uniref:sensor histidine kinase n=1 Tax=Desulfitobacterium metallireducens TaxID=142877 RepID=UPI00143BD236|nr:histidine kinase [Desulfitobacterium metallireducens]
MHLSWLAASILYLVERPQISLGLQLGVIVFLYLIGRYFGKIYIQYVNVRTQNKELRGIYSGFIQDMEHVFALYQNVESLPISEQYAAISEMICQRVLKMSAVETVFVWLEPSKTLPMEIVAMPVGVELIKEDMSECIEKVWGEVKLEPFIKRVFISGQPYLIIPMITTSSKYGVIGVKCDVKARNINLQVKQIEVIAKWSSTIIERLCIDTVFVDCMIKEERKRIANEIHDGVAQRLFGVTSAAYALKANGKFSETGIREQLDVISDSANKAMQELRLIIYGLNRRQETQINFFENIKEYLSDAAHLNQVDINVELRGNENKLNLANKRSIFRIIKEATGNAIRHGHSTQINVRLEIDVESLKLIIIDNGQGFNSNALDDRRLGLGLKNMESLTSKLQGDFIMESSVGTGTSIQVRIPLNRVRKSEKDNPLIGGVAS